MKMGMNSDPTIDCEQVEDLDQLVQEFHLDQEGWNENEEEVDQYFKGNSCYDGECQGRIHHHRSNICTFEQGWCCFHHAFLHGDLGDYEERSIYDDEGAGYYGESF
jgi:hypothetical protein